MINVINLATGSTTDIGSALASIGFTVDSSDSTKYYYDNDTNHKIYVKVSANGSNANIRMYTSGNSALGNVNIASATPCKLVYEEIGDSILFGIVASTASNKLHFGIIAPTSQDDDWIYIYPYNSTPINGRTEATFVAYGQIYQGGASGVAIVKAYDGSRFTDNLYVTAVSPSIATYADTSNINYATAQIDNDYYRVVNMGNYVNGACKYVIKLPSE